ncbi:hypothetical protein NLI96_g7792 [Meripilus lineatus]|uniref:ABC transporter domain-containing protein n=1 Tax=Meripilus lineatus TaxID=2056292 RepID=A0AAD5YEK4_9APHY|nr:hypothetical protein NLI96_g7792 [Physisporinus lineatus]
MRSSTPDRKLFYPDSGSPTKKGLAISAQNVSFQYPGPYDPRFALQKVSFDTLVSSLIVIVSANRSGKSLLDHVLFPISVGENIAIGDPDCEDGPEGRERIQAAVRLDGAVEVVRKLDQGLEEMTEREETLCSSPFPLPPGPLKEIAERVERYREFSGGEVQRLGASRTFMRISSGKVKLMVADEPTSAMDPEGELELFEALREVQDGMMMISITHRFGHLTKHADLILCLKDGELVKPRTHQNGFAVFSLYLNVP